MNSNAVTVTTSRKRGEQGSWWSIKHWGKYITGSDDWKEAYRMADELRKKLDRERFHREEKRREKLRSQCEPRVIPPEDLDTWRESANGRDPNAPTETTITVYPNEGASYRQRVLVPASHPFHWTHDYRIPVHFCRGAIPLDDGWGYDTDEYGRGSRTRLPSLPKPPCEDLIPIKPKASEQTVSTMVENATHKPQVAVSDEWSEL